MWKQEGECEATTIRDSPFAFYSSPTQIQVLCSDPDDGKREREKQSNAEETEGARGREREIEREEQRVRRLPVPVCSCTPAACVPVCLYVCV